MPITVACPDCNAKLNAPESAAGKRVKCPKCAKILTVPDNEFEVVGEDEEFEVVDDAPKKAVKRVVADDDEDDRPRRRREEDDEDDEEEDRPRKKKGKKGKKAPAKKSNTLMYVLVGVGICILLGCGGMFWAVGKVRDAASKVKAEMDAAWVTFNAPDGSFSVEFPTAPTTPDDMALSNLIGMDPAEAKKSAETAKAMGITPETWMATDGNRRYVVTMVKLPQAVPDPTQLETTLFAESRKQYEKIGTIDKEETVTVAGRSVKSVKVKTKNGKTLVTMFFVIQNRAYDLSILDDAEIPATDENVKKFLASFASTRQATGNPTPEGGGRRRR